ncbi:MAG: hypothetical protein AB1898_15055 [Acidobacteriota bacterium]
MAIKIRPGQPPHHYVAIDVTQSIDAVVWGNLWNQRFGWSNLLWSLQPDPGESQRRIDSAHRKLPILHLQERLDGAVFADTCLLPQGRDAKGVDKLWTPSDAAFNMEQAMKFMQTFILSPGVNPKTSSLNDTGSGITADVVYISSHGSQSGYMLGERKGLVFDMGSARDNNSEFAGPKWLLLSNCNSLHPDTHNDWLKLMSGRNPLRGVIGFQALCPFAEDSARLFASFINRLESGETFLRAWEGSLTAPATKAKLAGAWVVVCHENAKGDTISDFNDNRLRPIVSPSRILMFNKDNSSGSPVEFRSDPFQVFWTKNGVHITPANRGDSTNKIQVGDTVTITVKDISESGPTETHKNLPAGQPVEVTLVYTRLDFNLAIDVNQFFTAQISTDVSLSTTKLNHDSPGGNDSWVLVPSIEVPELKLTLRVKALTAMEPEHPLWLRARIGAKIHSFRRNASIIVK